MDVHPDDVAFYEGIQYVDEEPDRVCIEEVALWDGVRVRHKWREISISG